MSLLEEGTHAMTGTQWSELAGAVVTIVIALAGYLKAQGAQRRATRATTTALGAHDRIDRLESQQRHPTSQVEEAESASDNPG